jgi:hypothetical protein
MSQLFTQYGIRLSHKPYMTSPTKDVTWKDPPLIMGPLIGGYNVQVNSCAAKLKLQFETVLLLYKGMVIID